MCSNNQIIDITPSGDVSFTSNVNSFLKALNPLGAISETVGKIMACRVEIKRLKLEADTLKREYDSRNRMIDGTMKYAMKQLEQQRKEMENYFAHAAKQLNQAHLERKAIIDTISKSTKMMTDRRMSLEEKKLAQETITAMSKLLVESQQAGSATLSLLIDSSNKNLLSVPSLAGLLPQNTRR